MRVLLLVAHGAEDPAAQAERQLDLEHAIAICQRLSERGRATPFLALERDTALAHETAVSELPHRFIGAGIIGASFSLWGILRQLRGETFCIVAFGMRALRLGRQIQRLARKSALALAPVFLLRADPGFRARQGDIFLCGSRTVARQLDNGPQKQNPAAMLICQPGIVFEPLERCPATHFVFGMAQSLEPESGALTVVRAMACLWQREDLPAWEVRMYGGGPRYAEILGAARVLGVESRLCLLGHQWMPGALAQCSAWLAPGSSTAEHPATLWQGVACALPVIASKSPLHLERLEILPGAALLVPERDPQALAHAMISILCQRREDRDASQDIMPFMLSKAADHWAATIEELSGKAGTRGGME